jgi:hypothetical protein
VWTPGSQKEIARDELVAELKKTEKPGGTKLDTPTETISVYGDTAVVRGDSLGIKYTLTLVNQSGTWKAVALHTGK